MPELTAPGWLWLLPVAVALAALGVRVRVRDGRVRRIAAAALRAVALVAGILALAGPLEREGTRETDVLFALDVSRSIDRATAEEALDLVNRALAAKPAGARMGLVAFGADAAVEILPRRDVEPLAGISVDVPRDGTDIGRAIEVAVGAFAPGRQRRLVLLSDGRETLGRARAAAAVARAVGVEILAVPLEASGGRDEVAVQGIAVPSQVRVREPFEVRMTLRSSGANSGDLLILRDGEVIHEAHVALGPGANEIAIVDQVARPGLHEYEAIVNADSDDLLENNRYQAFVQARGAPGVLHAVGEPGEGRVLAEALRTQGLAVEEVPGTALPSTMHGLADYDLVILDNVSGFDLSLAKMEMLEAYVRDAGGGILKLGGSRSFGAGGYHDTPVERALPVTMDVRTEVRIPTLAMIVIIDKSASMASSIANAEKLSVAKVAALSAIEVLNPQDRIGVLAFDAEFEWSVEPIAAADRQPIVDKLRAIGAGGGTDLFHALGEAHRVITAIDAKVKHLIVLSDGLTDGDASFDALGAAIAEDGITVSTVAFGDDANLELMARIAAAGRGRAYHTADPKTIPRIFTSETMVVSRGLVVERETVPAILYPGEMLRGFGPGAFPALAGYQRTFPKPAAQVLLGAAEDDPLLVSWRYGLGRSAAFMSDLSGRWSRDWVAWPEFGRFVAQAARWTMRRSGNESIRPTFRVRGREAEVIVDVLDRDERFVNGLDAQATVASPGQDGQRVALEQIAPGRYGGAFEISGSGRYYVNISGVSVNGARDALRVGPRTFGLAVPYSSEFDGAGVDREHLARLAEATGGRVLPLAADSLEAILAPGEDRAVQRWRVWRPFVLLALLALVLEIAVRKVALPQALRRRLGAREPEEAREPGYEELRVRIARLREAHLEALRGGIESPDDPAARARLHVAARRR